MQTQLFDCSPKIAAKLARCEQIAKRQQQLTMVEATERGAGWTSEDFAILMPMNLSKRHCWTRQGDYTASRAYRVNLNA